MPPGKPENSPSFIFKKSMLRTRSFIEQKFFAHTYFRCIVQSLGVFFKNNKKRGPEFPQAPESNREASRLGDVK